MDTALVAFVDCGTNGENLGALAPENEVDPVSITLTSQGTPTFACGLEREDAFQTGHLAQARARQALSPDMTRVAVNWDDSADASQHVGYVDLHTGELVDVSEALMGEGGDFAPTPSHGNAVFARDGSFVFYDMSEDVFRWIDTATMSEIRSSPREEQYDTLGEFWWAGPAAMQSTRNMSGINYAETVVINSAGDEAMLTSSGPRVLDWFDGTSFLVVEDGRLAVWDLTMGEDPIDSALRWLTPDSDFSIRSAVPSEDLETVYFLAMRGEQCSLFKVPADGSAPPTKISDPAQCASMTLIRKNHPDVP